MMFAALTFAFLLSTDQAPLNSALQSAEPPVSVRAAFTVELTDGESYRKAHYDPRKSPDLAWRIVESEGKSTELDHALTDWSKEIAPDGRLFADDLRASMGHIVEVDDMGAAWRVHFRHHPSDNDGPIDVWAADHLAAAAWIEPTNQLLLRVDYSAPEPFEGPEGGRVSHYEHTYALQRDPNLGVTFISAFQVDVRGEFLGTNFERAYRARIVDVELFFSSPEAAMLFVSNRAGG